MYVDHFRRAISFLRNNKIVTLTNSLGTTGVVALWVAFVFITLMGFSLNNMKAFDPYGDMTFGSTLMTYERQLFDELSRRDIKPGTIVHLTGEQNCLCDSVADKFRSQLDKNLEIDGYQAVTLRINEKDPMRRFIPSTPSVVIINSDGGLEYVGPYAQGLGCYSGNGDIDKISDIVTDNNVPGAIVNAEAVGCYCYR